MRKYLYIWNNKVENAIIASGIEFADLLNKMHDFNGLLLLKNNYINTEYEVNSKFEYVSSNNLNELAEDDIYNYGDFIFVEYNCDLAGLSKKSISELLYFAHMGLPYNEIKIPGLGNDFLFYSHDDGWFLKIYYSEWPKIKDLLNNILNDWQKPIINMIKDSNFAVWAENKCVEQEKATTDIDSILNRRYRKIIKKPWWKFW